MNENCLHQSLIFTLIHKTYWVKSIWGQFCRLSVLFSWMKKQKKNHLQKWAQSERHITQCERHCRNRSNGSTQPVTVQCRTEQNCNTSQPYIIGFLYKYSQWRTVSRFAKSISIFSAWSRSRNESRRTTTVHVRTPHMLLHDLF